MATPGKVYYSVGWKAPKGLKPGDIVVTERGGTWAITGVNPDGTYKSSLVDPNINKSNYVPTRESSAPVMSQELAKEQTSKMDDGGATALARNLVSAQGSKALYSPSAGGSITPTRSTSAVTPTLSRPTTPTLSSPSSPTYSAEIQEAIKNLSEAQKANQIAGLTAAMNKALANLDTQESTIKDTYYNQRNRAAADADVGAYNFAQYMASRGIKGNAGAMPEIYRNAGLQNRLGWLGQQEAQAYAGIADQRSSIQNTYESDVQAAKAAIEAQALENYINQMNLDRSFMADQESALRAYELQLQNQQLAQQDYDLQMQRFLEQQAAAQRDYELQNQKYLDQQLAAQKQEYAQNVGAYHSDYQAEINRIQGDNDPSNDWMIPILQNARNQKIANTQEREAAAAQQEFENWLAMQRLNTGSSSGSTPSMSQLDSDMNDIYRINIDPVTGQLTEAGKSALRNYAAAYGGQYSDQLLSKWVGPEPIRTTGSGQQQSPGYYTVFNYANNMRAIGKTPDEIADFLAQRIGSNITSDEALKIARQLNLPI